jgi:hypothetical protein
MSAALRLLKLSAVGMLVLLLGACASSYPTRSVSYKETALDRPATPPGETELLSVRIEAFDAGTLPEDPDVAKGLSPEIRNAEAYYIPVQLKNTMQKSGHWGPVRVVPKGTREGEVVVSGRIVESDGEILKLAIDVRDAAGVRWFSKEYESVVDAAAYQKAEQGGIDAFQDLYTRVANDIAAHKQTLKAEDRTAIRQVADLRFGAEFAPAVFEGYLKRDEKPETGFASLFKSGSSRAPTYTVARLPAEDDPLVQRVNRIRAREELLVDTLDQQYDGLSRGVGEAYTKWRTSRLKEINALRESDRVQNNERAKGAAIGVLGVLAGVAIASQNRGGSCYGCTSAGLAVGGIAVAVGAQMAVKAYEQASSETQLHKAALEELGQSLATDVKPTVVEVEGKTVELKGTVEQKFQSWREVLQNLRDSENAPLAPVSPTT